MWNSRNSNIAKCERGDKSRDDGQVLKIMSFRMCSQPQQPRGGRRPASVQLCHLLTHKLLLILPHIEKIPRSGWTGTSIFKLELPGLTKLSMRWLPIFVVTFSRVILTSAPPKRPFYKFLILHKLWQVVHSTCTPSCLSFAGVDKNQWTSIRYASDVPRSISIHVWYL